MNYCKDCKFVRRDITGYRYAKCARPSGGGISCIAPGIGNHFCSTEREHDGLCGKDGRYFVQRAPGLLQRLARLAFG